MNKPDKGFKKEDKNHKNILIENDHEFKSLTQQAILLARKGRFSESEKIYRFLISKGKFDYLTFHRLAGILESQNKNQEAILSLKKSIKLKYNYAEAYSEIGRILLNNGEFKISLDYFQTAIKYNPKLIGPYINIGNIFAKTEKNDDALMFYQKALKLKKDIPIAHYNIGTIYFKKNNLIDSEISYKKALRYDNNFISAKIELINIYLETFNLRDLKSFNSFINEIGLSRKDQIYNLLTFFYLDSSPKKQYLRALNFSKRNYKEDRMKIKQEINNIIRIGYISANFNDHPVSKVMETIFKYHDKSKFELFAYSLNSCEDDFTQDLKKYFKKFTNIGKLTIQEIVSLIRADKLDIAIDLMGYTKKNKIAIFNKRVAPIQINYLGFAGTSGSKNMDYLIADKYVIPKSFKRYYSEKILYMPNSFINSIKYEYNKNYSDDDIEQLPKGSFLLAAFHRTSKLSESVMSTWLNILLRQDKTYLWLKDTNEIAKRNILDFFESNKVETNRILFAKRVDSYHKHISRYSSANLFLDTFFYNGHSTLVECIWSELPFISLPGESFSSRVGGSILSAINLPELICKNSDEYAEKVIFYSNNLEKLEKVKKKIIEHKKNGDFFNQKIFTKEIESIYLKLCKACEK